MKKRIFIATVLIVGIYVGWRFTRDGERAFFAEHSKIKLPFSTSDVVHSHKFEFACSSHYTIPPENRLQFAEQNHFSTAPPKNFQPIFHVEDLPAPWNKLPETGTFRYATGVDSFTAWDVLFHLESGSLWTSIYYADYHGDLPPRVKQLRQ